MSSSTSLPQDSLPPAEPLNPSEPYSPAHPEGRVTLWGPYLSERQWGTVREDYSADGDAWNYFSHDEARSRAYRWGEDGIAGISDLRQTLCFSVALWNGKDPFLKERLFGLTNAQGNHGEDVKECYYYLDATPDHSYLKMLYKYPQAEFPYAQLLQENQRRGLGDNEYELIDTGVFEEDRYWDVFVEYALASDDDILIKITVYNRGPETATIHVLPHLWFRNTWSWDASTPLRPVLRAEGSASIHASHHSLGDYSLYVDGNAPLLFCENDTNGQVVYGQQATDGYFKDAFHRYIVGNDPTAVNPSQQGTKACVQFVRVVPSQQSAQFRLRLCAAKNNAPFGDFDELFSARVRSCDEYYANLATRHG